jgi:hypothetical protein
MKSPEKFMREFMKAIVHNPLERPAILAEWTEKLEARDIENRQMEPDTDPEEEQ